MPKIDVKSYLFVSIVIAVFYYVYFIYFYTVHSTPPPGDSWDYHIPIAQNLLQGIFFSNDNFKMAQWYYPASSEFINAVFIALKIPLTYSNIFATGVLFLACIALARTFKLTRDYALLFGITIITLNIILRWLNQVSVDVWIAVFFCITVITLERLKPSIKSFAILGFNIGMMIGSKYTASTLLIPLIFPYLRTILSKVNFSRILIFFGLLSFFGFFWYIRNYLLTGNPFYPLPILGFPGKEIFGDMRVWNIGIEHPIQMIDAAIGEYKIWIFSIPIAILYLIKKSLFIKDSAQNKEDINQVGKIFLIALTLITIYLFYPTSREPWIMVSSLRYSYPAFILLILGIFKLGQIIKKESLIGFFAITGMLGIFGMEYHPKLILISIPISLILIFYANRFITRSEK